MPSTNTLPGTASDPAGTPLGVPFKLLFSRKDAADVLSISVRSLDYFIADGEIETRKIGGRTLIPLSSLKQFARRDHPGRMN